MLFSIQGTIHKAEYPNFSFEINGVRIKITAPQYRALQDGKDYTIYYVKPYFGHKMIISIAEV
ncbi:MAG: hypothetical protein GF364_22255 [Candidatus Lokiarchaeota archaeon]|nr:hypothetical protein [Candidatus Lokiarchaeota archaeon]